MPTSMADRSTEHQVGPVTRATGAVTTLATESAVPLGDGDSVSINASDVPSEKTVPIDGINGSFEIDGWCRTTC